MNIHEIKDEKEKKFSQLSKDVGLFWAFSNQQFEENRTPLKEGEKYISIGGGGYMPKGNYEAFEKGYEDIEAWYKQAVKDNKQRKALISYELANHECYYTGDIQSALDVLGEDYTREEVLEVYRAERKAWVEMQES